MSRIRAWGLAAVTAVGMVVGGCNTKSFFDPSETVRGDGASPLPVRILDRLPGNPDEPEKEFEEASDVTPDDTKVIATDYIVGKNDVLTISIFDIVNKDVESVRTARVSESGMISLPLLTEPMKAAGLTEAQLQKAIVEKYRTANIITNAQVSVTVNEARQRTFSILGAVTRPGQYAIVDTNFRVLDALVQANDTTFQADNLYVIRRLSSERPSTTQPASDAAAPKATPTSPSSVDPLAPRSMAPSAPVPLLAEAIVADPATAPTTRPVTEAPEGGRFISIEGKTSVLGSTQPAVGAATETAAVPTTGATEAATTTEKKPFTFGSDQPETETRVIRVPLAQLRAGDLRYNIVIRPYDTVVVPMPLVGEYFMGGHVARPGAYTLTGRKLTLKQAVISASGLDQLAIQQHTDVVRRVGKDKEVYVRVDLEQIFEGTAPDMYLRPNDQVLVGTNAGAPFLAALRGAFRITYGFGFLYDRNYAMDRNGNYQ